MGGKEERRERGRARGREGGEGRREGGGETQLCSKEFPACPQHARNFISCVARVLDLEEYTHTKHLCRGRQKRRRTQNWPRYHPMQENTHALTNRAKPQHVHV